MLAGQRVEDKQGKRPLVLGIVRRQAVHVVAEIRGVVGIVDEVVYGGGHVLQTGLPPELVQLVDDMVDVVWETADLLGDL